MVTLQEIRQRFTWNPQRLRLFEGLVRAVQNLVAAGVRKIWIDGSFVTAKDHPNDIDGCWEFEPSMDWQKLDPVLLDQQAPRAAMKAKYHVDFLISAARLSDAQGKLVKDFFQEDHNRNRKGLLLLQKGPTS